MTTRAHVRYRRRKKLIKPALQMKVVCVFLAIVGLSSVVQAFALIGALEQLALNASGDQRMILDQVPDLVTRHLLITLVVLVPIVVVSGVLVTFRIAGPIHRFEVFLRSVIAGEQAGACTLRKHDELHELCELLNEATAPLRGSGGDAPQDGAAGGREQPAAEVAGVAR